MALQYSEIRFAYALDRLDVAVRIRDVSSPEHQRYATWDAAHAAYSKVHKLQALQPVPAAGTVFDSPINLPPLPTGHWKDEEPEEIKIQVASCPGAKHPREFMPFSSSRFYVITRGQEVGIFKDWYVFFAPRRPTLLTCLIG